MTWGGADLLFQHDDGITILAKTWTFMSDVPWIFDHMASSDYGSWIGEWNLGRGDLVLPLAGDFTDDSQNDF
jgi:hypothetical protein